MALVAADFDDDGFDDLAVGAPGVNGHGAVYLYRGSRTGLVADRELPPTTDGGNLPFAGADFGAALAAADINNDGVPELLVGAPGDRPSAGANDCGSIYTYRLGGASDLVARWNPGGSQCQPGTEAGASLAGTSRNGSHGKLIVVGGPGADSARGRAWLLGYANTPALSTYAHLTQSAADACSGDFLDPNAREARHERHPLEIDLDLAGVYGLHRLLDVAVTAEGREQLRQWLIAGEPEWPGVLERQALVAELRPRSLFRDKLALAGQLFRARDAHTTTILLRPNGPTLISSLRSWLIGLGIAAAINLLLLLLNQLGLIGPIWQVGVLLFLVVGGLKGQQAGDVFKDAAALRDTLEQWLNVFLHLEKDRYAHTPHLRQLCAPFRDGQKRPSHYLQRANRIVNATGVRGNPIVWLLLNAFFPWDLFFLYRLELVKS